MTWQDLHHSELTVPQLYALLKLRSEVFVVEQQCAYQDVDGDDLVGENRPAARGEKLGHQLMAQALASCQRHWPQKSIYLGAQAHLQAFYAHFGFTPVTEVYDEDGIPHIGMARESRAV